MLIVSSVSPRIKKRGGGGWIEHLEAVFLCLGTYIASLYYYHVLPECGKKGVLCPLPPLGETLSIWHQLQVKVKSRVHCIKLAHIA